ARQHPVRTPFKPHTTGGNNPIPFKDPGVWLKDGCEISVHRKPCVRALIPIYNAPDPVRLTRCTSSQWASPRIKCEHTCIHGLEKTKIHKINIKSIKTIPSIKDQCAKHNPQHLIIIHLSRIQPK